MKSEHEINFWLGAVLFVLIAVGLTTGLIIALKTNLLLDKKIAEAKEAERPANLEILTLKDSNCQECFKLDPLLAVIKKENVKIITEMNVEVASAEGMDLIKKYNIDKAPMLIISGEIEKNETLKKLWQQLGEVKDNIFILRNVGAPYLLTISGDIRGKVKLVELTDTKCKQCYDVTKHEAILKNFGVYLEDTKILDFGSKEAKKLVSNYKIKLLPTIILTGDLSAYPDINAVWPQVGTVEKDGTYIFREGVKQMGTYKDLTSGKIIAAVLPSKANE